MFAILHAKTLSRPVSSIQQWEKEWIYNRVKEGAAIYLLEYSATSQSFAA